MQQQEANKINTKTTSEGGDLRAKIQGLLDKAAQERQTSLKQAIATLEEAARLIPKLHAEEQQNKPSVRNATENKSTLEVLYLSKRGNVNYELGNYQEAQSCYTEVKQRTPNNNKVYKALGDALRKQGQYQEAIKLYDDGIDIYDDEASKIPKDKAALLNSKGLALLELDHQYDEAIKCFDQALQIAPENPLYLCNKGRVLHAKNDYSYLNCFQEAYKLTQKENSNVEGLTKDNISFINKTLNRFINLLNGLKEVDLNKDDSVMVDREHHYVEKAIAGLNDSKDNVVDDAKQMIDTKKKVKEIEKEPNLHEFYDGFLYTLCQSYSTSVVVGSGTFSIDTGNPAVSGAKCLISMIPFVGSHISEGVGKVWHFINTAIVTKAAANVTKFATDLLDFKAIAQDAVVAIIIARQDKIKGLKKVEADMLSKWKGRFRKVFDKLKEAEEFLYGNRMETPMQKLGYQTAADLIAKYIANGQIYEGNKAISLTSEIKTQRLVKVGVELLDKGVDENLEDQILYISNDNSVQPISTENLKKNTPHLAAEEDKEGNKAISLTSEIKTQRLVKVGVELLDKGVDENLEDLKIIIRNDNSVQPISKEHVKKNTPHLAAQGDKNTPQPAVQGDNKAPSKKPSCCQIF